MTPEQHRIFEALCLMQGLPLEDQLWLLAQATGLPPLLGGAAAASLSLKKAA